MTKIRFLGGAGGVGKSSVEVIDEGKSVVLDSGVDFGAKGRERFPLDPQGDLLALVLTHAHLDHSGYAPALVSREDVRVLATPPTVDISEILLRDFLNLFPEEEEPPFSNKDIQVLRKREAPIRFGLSSYADGSWEIIPFNAGHVLGSAMIYLKTPSELRLLYTGDINTAGTKTLRGAETNLPEIDVLIIESTYGGDSDIHPARKKVERRFAEDVKNTVNSGGVVIVPAFALGRAQEVLLTIIHYMESGFLPEVPVFVDGMIREVSKFYSMYWTWLRPELQRRVRESRKGLFDYPTIEEVRSRDELLEITEPFIVVTTSGMLQGGPVLTYLKHFGTKPGNLIYLTGYQVRGTRGRMLLDGERQIPMPDGSVIEIRAEVKFADFSAHADQPNLINFISKLWGKGLKEVILVHGEVEKMKQLRTKLEKKGIKTYIPRIGEVLEYSKP